MHWARLGTTFATIRRKSVIDRFEVGYWNKERVVLGAGPTWEIAFERALKPRTEIFTPPIEALMQPARPSRAPREEAERTIRAFLRAEGFRSFEMIEDGEEAWAFWPTSKPHTTSYYHADGSVEWYCQGRR